MRGTIKGDEPQKVSDWKAENAGIRLVWGQMPPKTREALELSLWLEQKGLCVYCGRRLTLGAKTRLTGKPVYHIEHFRPKDRDRYPELVFEHSNLLLSCGREHLEDDHSKPEGRTCGDAKDNWFSEELHVPVAEAECQKRFMFTVDGEVSANPADAAAEEMIKRLKLNDNQLRVSRRDLWLSVSDVVLAEYEAANGTDLDSILEDALAEWLRTDAAGGYQSFAHVIAHMLRAVITTDAAA